MKIFEVNDTIKKTIKSKKTVTNLRLFFHSFGRFLKYSFKNTYFVLKYVENTDIKT